MVFRMDSGFTLADVESQPFQCHFTWGFHKYFGMFTIEKILDAYKFYSERAEKEGNIVRQFSYHMCLAYIYYLEKNLEEHARHAYMAQALSKEDPGMLHVFQANFYFMLYGTGMRFDGNTIDSYAVPCQKLSACSQAIVWAIRSLSLKALFSSCAIKEAIKGFEKASSHDPKNYEWQVAIGQAKRKMRRVHNEYQSLEKPELINYIEAVRLGGRKLHLALALSELSHNYLKIQRKSYAQLKDLMKFVHDLMIEVLAEEPLYGRDFVSLGKFFYQVPMPFKNTKLAKECFEKGVLVDPNDSAVNHMFGKYLIFQKQYTEALLYLEKAVQCSESGNFLAEMEALQIKSDLSEDLNVSEEIQQLLKRCRSPDEKATLYCKLADFLINSQPRTALKLYKTAVNMTEAMGLNDWSKGVYKYLWQQQPDGSRVRISNQRYEFQNIHDVIFQLEKKISRATAMDELSTAFQVV